MSLVNDVKSDIKAAKKFRLSWRDKVGGIIASTLCAWLFYRFGRLDLALPAMNCVAVLGFMLILKRRLWRHSWFWGTMAVIVALHVPLILFVPWGTSWVPALAIAVVDSVDLCLILWILAVVEKFMREPKGA